MVSEKSFCASRVYRKIGGTPEPSCERTPQFEPHSLRWPVCSRVRRRPAPPLHMEDRCVAGLSSRTARRDAYDRNHEGRNALTTVHLPPTGGAKNPIDREFGSMLE
jgi:hypothetical protein